MHYIITALGCKVNQYEAQAIETLLHAHGFTPAADGEPVDLIVVNTYGMKIRKTTEGKEAIMKDKRFYVVHFDFDPIIEELDAAAIITNIK